ncbi:MAG TPA: hypothetical protein VHY20_10725, partial [Pirellulales bacterium]|nr:hypothetical protein [Pirellulales bacterium]
MQSTFVTRARWVLPGLLAWLLGAGCLPQAAKAEPDEQALGKAEDYPRGTPATMHTDHFKVGSFSAADK